MDRGGRSGIGGVGAPHQSRFGQFLPHEFVFGTTLGVVLLLVLVVLRAGRIGTAHSSPSSSRLTRGANADTELCASSSEVSCGAGHTCTARSGRTVPSSLVPNSAVTGRL